MKIHKPCDICLEEKCEGRHDCHCETCELYSKCYRRLHPTIRITNRCTQQCSHCCFSSHPKSEIMMSVATSQKIATFFRNNLVYNINLMGGEFFCNPDWFEIFSNFVREVGVARIVTNGDWAPSDTQKEKLSEFINQFKDKVWFSISKDKWHTNKNVEAAAEFLKSTGIHFNVTKPEEASDAGIVPVGRSMLGGGGFYDFMGCYCQNPENMYSFLIDEEGNIYKCGFGMFKYATVDDYVDGGFRERFKKYNTAFYKQFIPSCKTCSNFNFFHNNKEHGQIMVKTE